MEKRFENFTVSILKLSKLVQKIKNYEMRSFGLKAVHVMCLYYLKNSERGLTAAEVSRLTLEDKAAVSRAFAQMVKKGYIRYDGDKKYNALATLTQEGRKVADYIDARAEGAVNAGGGGLSEKERENFYAALDSIAERLEKYCGDLQ